MALVDGVRVKETTTTTGTGTLTLAGAFTGHQTFLSAIGEGNQCFYWIQDSNGTNWECGIGTVSGSTLSRTTVLRSTNSNVAISLTSGVHTVWISPVPGYATGDINFQDLLLQRPSLKDYSEVVATPSISAGVLTLNLETANVFNVSHNANITSVVLQNPPASGYCGSVTLILTQDATGGRTLTGWPAAVKWSGGTAPTISTTANKENVFSLFTVDGGTKWRGALAGKDYA